MNKKHLGYLAIVLLMMLYCLPAVSQKVLATIVKNGELRVGTSGTQPPYSMKSKTGELMGFEIDLANALATNMGVKLKLVEIPEYVLTNHFFCGIVSLKWIPLANAGRCI